MNNAIVCVKVIAECKEDALLEAVKQCQMPRIEYSSLLYKHQ